MRRVRAPQLAVVLGYVLAALAFSWPLPLHLGTHFTGDPGGDTGVYVWNQWVFHQELTTGHNPLATEKILSLTSRRRSHATQLHRVPQHAGAAADLVARRGGLVQRGVPDRVRAQRRDDVRTGAAGDRRRIDGKRGSPDWCSRGRRR